MRVAFLASPFLDPDHPSSWSGLPYFMRRALNEAGVETITLRPEETDQPRRWARFLYWRLLRGKRYLRHCDARLLQDYARQYERQLAALAVDAIFSPSTWLVAYLETDLPVVFWTDACFAGILGFYESFADVAPPSVEAGHEIEQRALQRSTRALYSSEWAAESACRFYQVDSSKVGVLPFGGNFQEPPTLEEAAAAIERRPATPWELLLVGVDWKRKGADIAVEAVECLSAAGIPVRLTIVGCRPPHNRMLPSEVTVVPFIGKESAEDRRHLREIFERSHFFIMPSRAEAFGIVYAEANAFGVPCLATNVGGLPFVITNDVNGRLFPLEARGEDYAAYIIKLLRRPSAYRALALRSAQEAAQRLSWKVSGRKLAAMLGEISGAETGGITVPFIPAAKLPA